MPPPAPTSIPLPCVMITPRPPEAFVVRSGGLSEDSLDRTRAKELLGFLSLASGPGPRVAIATDGPIPASLIRWLFSKGASGITAIALTIERILSENTGIVQADAAERTAVAPGLSLCAPWADHDVRIVFSRVKIDGRGAYSLCGAALESCVSEGGLGALLDRYPPHCSIVADPVHDVSFVIADHPLLADWVGAALMGRDPYSARGNAELFRRGLLPRTYRVHGDTSPLSSWVNPPSLKRPLPHALRGGGAAPEFAYGWTEAAQTWISFVKAACEPFLSAVSPDPAVAAGRTGKTAATRAALIEKISSAITPESLGELLEALLKGLSLLVMAHPVLKEDVRGFRAGYCIATRDNRMRVHARFIDGNLTASRSADGQANVTLIFKDGAAMLRLFASPKPDLLDAMLKQQVAFEGNLNYLLKLAYLLRRVMTAVKGDLRSVI